MIDVSEEAGGRMDVDADGGEGPAGVEQPGEEEGGADHPAESKKVTAKFLVSNPAAGSIIGRAGSNISQLQQQSGARLQLSRSGDYFAGTQDRIMLATGTVNQILTALHLVLTKVKDEQVVMDSMMTKDRKNMQLKMLVPSVLCGTIIGKSGNIIRGFAEDSKAAITVSSQDRQLPGVSERVVRITGQPEQLMRATALLLSKLSEHPHFGRHTQHPFGPLASGEPSRSGPGRRQHEEYGGGSFDQRKEITIGVPESRVGAVIGRGGEVINTLKNMVGVKIRVSDREDFLPGTRNRKVTISGDAESVDIARRVIDQKIRGQAP